MAGLPLFDFDPARAEAPGALRPEHSSDFRRLIKRLRFGTKFQFAIAEFNDGFYRDALLDRIDALLADNGLSSARLMLRPGSSPDVAAVEERLLALAAGHQVIHVLGGESWFNDARWEGFNVRREAVAHGVAVRLVFWLTKPQIARLALKAPDFWAWRSGVFSFEVPAPLVPPVPLARLRPIDNRSVDEHRERLAVLRASLAALPPLDDATRLPLLDELAQLLTGFGDLDEALAVRTDQQLPTQEARHDAFGAAMTKGEVADILAARGQIGAALEMLRDAVLPTLRAIGNVHAMCAVQLRMADLMRLSGQEAQALQLLRQEVLPAAQALGDRRLAATANEVVGTILWQSGDPDGALGLWRQDVVPVYEQLGDLEMVARVQARIMQVLAQRGLPESLSPQNLAAYGPDLAASLNNLAVDLSDQGERAAALAASHRAVKIRERLVLQDFAAHGPDLAISLINLSNHLAAQGERAAALVAIQRAVEIVESLAQQNFAAYGPILATSLNNLSNRLAALGESAAALVAIQRAVEIRERLAQQNFAAYGPGLAGSLNNLSNRLCAQGERAAALVAIQRAVEINESLAQQNFGAYGPDLAQSLNNLSIHLFDQGERAAALVAIQRSVEIRESLAQQNPARHAPDLAGSLAILAHLSPTPSAIPLLQRAIRLIEPYALPNTTYGDWLQIMRDALQQRLAE